MGEVYIDESGQPRGGTYLVLGGLASTVDRWKKLESEWYGAKSDYDFPLDANGEHLPYHCTDVFSDKSRLSREQWPVSLETKHEMHERLSRIIVRHVAATAYTAVLYGSYAEVFVDKEVKRKTQVYPICGLGITSRLYRWARRSNEPLDYIFEKAKGVNQGSAMQSIVDLSNASGRSLMIRSVTHLDKGIPALDAADIWCYELKQHIDSLGVNPSDSLLRLSRIPQQCGYLLGNDIVTFADYLRANRGTAPYLEIPIRAHPVPITESVFKEQV